MRSIWDREIQHTLPQARIDGIAADAASRISLLSAETLAAPDDDDDNPFLTLDEDEDELEANELTVEDTQGH